MRTLLLRARKATAHALEHHRPPPPSLQRKISNASDRILEDAITFHEGLPPHPDHKTPTAQATARPQLRALPQEP